MNKGSFDDHIKKKLDSFEEKYDSSSWDLLSAKLEDISVDDDDLPDDEFIPIVKQKLEGHEETFKEEHWQILNEKLDFIESRRRRLYVLKFAEAAILLLLIYTYWNYRNISGAYEVQVNESYVMDMAIPDEEKAVLSGEVQPKLLVSSRDRNPVRSSSGNLGPVGPISISPLTFSHDDKHILSLAPITEVKGMLATLDKERYISKLPLNSFDITVPNKLFPANSQVEEKVLENKPSRKGWWINLPFSYDVNMINSAFDFGYLTSNIDRGVFGQSVGAMISYQINNFEFETGIKYSDKTYAPGLLKNYSISSRSKNSILESELDAAYLRQIQIPLVMKVHAFTSTRSNLYAAVGIGFNAILDSDYSIKKSIQPFARVDALDVTKSLLQLRDLPEGLAEGGHFEENVYGTLIVGFGLQTEFKEGVAMFIQPQFQYNFTHELNQFIEKVHSFNLEAGIKFKL